MMNWPESFAIVGVCLVFALMIVGLAKYLNQ
jgi:hypothetical protein